jgi:hypothetical protein
MREEKEEEGENELCSKIYLPRFIFSFKK